MASPVTQTAPIAVPLWCIKKKSTQMRKFPLFAIILTLIIACIQIKEPNNKIDHWLRQYSLSLDSFKVSTTERTFELWAYTWPIEKLDSSFNRASSEDSSFTLVTNFSKKRINKGSLEFHFIDNRSKALYIGVEILENYTGDFIDYHWIDGKSIFMSFKDSSGIYTLEKFKMQADTVWTYSTKRSNNTP
jgi:hypothetical protein